MGCELPLPCFQNLCTRRRAERVLPQVNSDTYLGSRTPRSEEHTSELQSLRHLVCRLLLEKKKNRSYQRLLCRENFANSCIPLPQHTAEYLKRRAHHKKRGLEERQLPNRDERMYEEKDSEE